MKWNKPGDCIGGLRVDLEFFNFMDFHAALAARM